MSRRPGAPVSRGAALLGILATILTGAVLVAGVGWLRPPVLDSDVPTTPAGVSCAQPGSNAQPVPVTSATLLACPDVFDGRGVIVVGEAVGDLLRGPGGRRWVQVNDDPYALVGPLATHGRTLGTSGGIAVLLPADVVPAVLGRHGVWGDLLAVTGTFRATAPEDQGGPAVIARRFEVRRPGAAAAPLPATRLRMVTPVVAALTAALLLAVRRRRATLG